MSSDKERTTKYSGIGAQVEIKRRDPGARPTTAPGRLMEFTAEANELQNEIDTLKGQLKEAGRLSGVAPIGDFYKVEGRQRNLTNEEKDDLRANMKAVGRLITPITVEPRELGGWNIISGNNRYDRAIELGWTELDYHVFGGSEEQANSSAFYANLIHSSLPDYEKYLGFKKLMADTGMDQTGVSKDSGIDVKTISKIMAFDRLPASVKEILDERPSILGVTAAIELAKLAEQGRAEQVTQAVNKIVTSGITQSEAIALASKVEKKTVAKVAPQTFKIKVGRSKFAELRSINKTVRIDFEDQKKADEFATIFHDLLKEYADKLK